MSDDIKAIAFDNFKRSNPNVKKLATVWRGTPEFESWMNLYTDPDNEVVQYIEEDDHKLGTFYRKLQDREIKEETAVEEEKDENAAKTYQVIAVVHEHEDENEKHAVTHIKLGIPRWTKVGDRFALAEYVYVDQWRKTLDFGTYVETAVFVTDEQGTNYDDSIMHKTQSFSEVWEVMFSLGELPPTEPEYRGENYGS